SDSLSGTVRIGAPDGLANYLLPEAAAALAADNPALNVQIAALPRIFSLSRREADLAIAVSHPSAGRLRVRKIADYHLHAYMSRALLARTGPVARTAELGSITGIGYIPDMIFDKELDYFAAFGPDARPALTSNSLIVQLNWTLAGYGYCILPDFVARNYPELARILDRSIALRRSYYLLRHEDDRRVARINRTAEYLVGFLRREFAAVEKWSQKSVD
ncbi:MAG: substrate-binding domain-containing protein, partial [Gammaproteobacteria bacterium]